MAQVTVYLSNTDIQVLTGSSTGRGVTVKRFYSMELPEGSVLNGVITDAGSMVDAIRQLWMENKLPGKDINLVVNSPQIMVRVPEIPLQSDAKTISYLKREYIERQEEQILGFYRISSDKKTKTSKVCAEIADEDFLESYVQVFAEAGVQLSGIYSGVSSAINLFGKSGFASSENCVVLIRDGMTISAIFFVKGEYYYSTSARIFSNPGTIEYANEVAKTVNQIDQFSRSQKLEDPISTIYLAGMEPGDESLCARAISDTLSNPVSVSTLSYLKGVNTSFTGVPVDRLIYPAAALLQRTGHVNILKFIKKEKSAEQIRSETMMKIYLPYLLTGLVMACITVGLFLHARSRSAYLDSLISYNTDPDNKFAAIDYDVAARKVAVLSQHYGGLKVLEKHVNSYPAPVSQVWSVIRQDAAGIGTVQILGYSADSGELRFTTGFRDVTELNEFITRLKNEKIFTKVDYQGYSETSGDGQADEWTARLSCILSETAGRDYVPCEWVEPDNAPDEQTQDGEVTP